MKNTLNQNTENFSLKKIDWEIIQSEMRDKFGSDIYESWLRKIDFIDEFKNYILISVSTRFIRDWITSRYLDQILQIIKSHRKEINRIEFSINEKKQDKTDEHSSLRNKNIKEHINQKVSFIKDSFLQYNRIDPNKNFTNFILGSSNKLALEASKKVTQDLAHYNP